MPKLNKYRENYKSQLSDYAKTRIHDTLNAIEKYVMLCCIATGILQILILTHSSSISPQMLKYRRTVSSTTLTEDVIADYLRRNLFRFVLLCPDLAISRFILAKQSTDRACSANVVA